MLYIYAFGVRKISMIQLVRSFCVKNAFNFVVIVENVHNCHLCYCTSDEQKPKTLQRQFSGDTSCTPNLTPHEVQSLLHVILMGVHVLLLHVTCCVTSRHIFFLFVFCSDISVLRNYHDNSDAEQIERTGHDDVRVRLHLASA